MNKEVKQVKSVAGSHDNLTTKFGIMYLRSLIRRIDSQIIFCIENENNQLEIWQEKRADVVKCLQIAKSISWS